MSARLALAALLALAPAASALADDPSFTLVNRAPVAVRALFVTPAGDANWGQDRLRGHQLPAGGSFLVHRRADGNCIMDIRAEFADGRAEERKGLNTCDVDSVAVGVSVAASGKPADDPSIRLVNRGTQAIVAFYAAPAGRHDWGANRLGESPLPGATEKLVRIARADGCVFDLRVVFADHTAKERHGTDLCRIGDLPVP